MQDCSNQRLKLKNFDEISINELTKLYYDVLNFVAETEVPIAEKCEWVDSKVPWFSENFKILKRAKRKAEKVWRKTKLSVHHDIYKDCCKKLDIPYKKLKSSSLLL